MVAVLVANEPRELPSEAGELVLDSANKFRATGDCLAADEGAVGEKDGVEGAFAPPLPIPAPIALEVSQVKGACLATPGGVGFGTPDDDNDNPPEGAGLVDFLGERFFFGESGASSTSDSSREKLPWSSSE
jgi:hypothetical protein